MKELLLPTIIVLISGSIGYYIRCLIDKTKENNQKVTDERRVHYQQFVNIIVDIFKTTADKTKESTPDRIEELHEFYKKYLVYASSDVINAFGDYFQFLFHQDSIFPSESKAKSRKHFALLSQVVIKMRKDLGLNNKKLGKYGERIFRATITDIDEIFK